MQSPDDRTTEHPDPTPCGRTPWISKVTVRGCRLELIVLRVSRTVRVRNPELDSDFEVTNMVCTRSLDETATISKEVTNGPGPEVLVLFFSPRYPMVLGRV